MKLIESLVWKNLSIAQKICIGIGSVVTILLFVAWQSNSGISGILGDASEVIEGNKLNSVLVQKKLDHLEWSNNLVELFTDVDVTQLSVEMDSDECLLGQWLASEDRRQAEELVPDLKPLFQQLEHPHNQLHASAERINTTFRQNHGDLATDLSAIKESHITWVAELGHALADEAGGIYTYQNMLVSNTQQVYSLLSSIAENESKGSILERQQQAIEALKAIRYGNDSDGYFFVLNTDLEMVMHPFKPELDGTDLSQHEDVNGMKLFVEMNEECLAHDKGFVTYYWNLPGGEEVAPKISFVQYYEPWNWIVGTGVYVDHNNQALLKRVGEFADNVPFSIDLEMDSETCELGAFLIDSEMLKLAESFPDLKDVVNRLKEPHEHLHDTARRIEASINDLNMQDAISIYQNETQADLEEIKTLFDEAITAENRFTEQMRAAEEIYTIETVPALEEIEGIMDELRIVLASNLKSDSQMLLHAKSVKTQVLICGIVAFIFGVTLMLLVSRAISRPLLKAVDHVKEIASGDLSHVIGLNQKDEVGQLASNLNEMTLNLKGIVEDISSNSNNLSCASTELASTSSQLTSSSETMNVKAKNVSETSEQLSMGMQTAASATESLSLAANEVAASVEEMTQTINEISKSCHREHDIVNHANLESQKTLEAMAQLREASSAIGNVVELITSVAEQTNLLALNATIEAASAGDAGKGFAVVAAEVKELATQTSKATSQISHQIDSIQSSSRDCDVSIQKVVNFISEVNEISDTIATAVEEQSATTNQIAKAIGNVSDSTNQVSSQVNQSAQGTEMVSNNIDMISESADYVVTGANHTNSSSENLAAMATKLNVIVSKFKID